MPTPTQDSVFEDASTIVTPLVAADATKRENVVDRFMAGLPTYDESSEAVLPPPEEPPPADPLDKTSAWPAAGTAANLAALKADATIGDTGTAKPTAAFTAGQFVTLADSSKAHWDGSAWVAGAFPAA